MKKVMTFMLAFLFVFSPVPILGVYTQKELFNKSVFNYSYSLYLLGISSDKNKAVIGSDGWLFLGNNYDDVINKSKSEYLESERSLTKNEDFMNKLSMIAEENGAIFKFIAAPNKHSIYGEHIGLDSSVGSYSYYNDNVISKRSFLVSYLREIKMNQSRKLYFKSDTHWNCFGAFFGYQYLMDKTLNRAYKKIPKSYGVNFINKGGGDLARFLNISEYIRDENIIPLEQVGGFVARTNLVTKKMSKVGIQGNINNAAIKEPIKIVNVTAKNNLNILWLHDSFGMAMSPYMHITFSEVTHQHYAHAFSDMSKFKSLIKEVNPKIILLSVVERNSLSFGSY